MIEEIHEAERNNKPKGSKETPELWTERKSNKQSTTNIQNN